MENEMIEKQTPMDIFAIEANSNVIKILDGEHLVDRTHATLINEKDIPPALTDENGVALYKIENGAIVPRTPAEILQELQANIIYRLREQRRLECFPVINRGQLWYGRLTDAQKSELDGWYNAWLNVTDTKEIPEKPTWLR